ncbi:PaaI family thioesterase [Sagittula sp. M10.9X]|uniref:PaaI family thioesterase n=2 Tax=Sagittula salina TaxID=2820268 RepID=A0A940S0Y1_9RHOB|nr:PaaI family thioesterase [Sagittula salina]MBP0482556.1 PaaI family thioesterase [Sagittula salina]
MTLDTRIRDSFLAQGFLQTMGATLDHVAPGAVHISVPLGPALTQQQGFAHGGVGFSIADSAAGFSALTLVEAPDDVVTSDMTIHYLSPAIGDRLIARGTVLRPGRRMLVTQADVYALRDGREVHAARLTGTMVRVTPR